MDFEYVAENVPGPGANRDDFETDLAGCDCREACTAANRCACLPYDQVPVYTLNQTNLRFQDNFDNDRRLLHSADSNAPILECSRQCRCMDADSPCANRCSQLGIACRLEVFAIAGKGYGLRTLDAIQRGRFVCDYAGEVIDAAEVERRASCGKREHNYVLTLKEHFAAGPRITYIDPSFRGNLARFINHSCSPNLLLTVIRRGQRIPHVSLFAVRPIAAGEELSYYYGPVLSNIEDSVGTKLCLCGFAECQGYLPTSPTATW